MYIYIYIYTFLTPQASAPPRGPGARLPRPGDIIIIIIIINTSGYYYVYYNHLLILISHIPMTMPKTVCITNVYCTNRTAGSLYNFFGRGYGYEYHSSETSRSLALQESAAVIALRPPTAHAMSVNKSFALFFLFIIFVIFVVFGFSDRHRGGRNKGGRKNHSSMVTKCVFLSGGILDQTTRGGDRQ